MRFASWAGAIAAYYPPPSLDPAVSDWVSRIGAAGGSVSEAQTTAVNTFVDGLKADGLWTKIRRLNPFVGEQLTAALIPLVNTLGDTADTGVNLVSGDFSATLGITGNGSSKYIQTGAVPSSYISGVAAYLSSVTSAASRYAIGSVGSPGIAGLMNNSPSFYRGYSGVNYFVSINGTVPTGLLHVQRRSASDLELYQAGASVGVNTAVNATPTPVNSFYVLAANQDGSPTAYSPTGNHVGGYALLDGTLTDTDAANLSARWATLRSSL